jgi:phosphate starvation-inducible protein PhoH
MLAMHDFKCKTKTQKDLIIAINGKEIIISAAGVGKSYVSIARAIELLRSDDNKFNKIIISTPIVEADEN